MRIETPFEVGDYVYIIRLYSKPRIEREQVAEIGCDNKGQYVIIGATRSNLNKFNKTFFISKAEAEKVFNENIIEYKDKYGFTCYRYRK